MTDTKLLKLYSKDKESLKHFIKFLKQINKKWKNSTFVFKNIKKKRKRITILKSPHVNKKAQTQFQSITYSTLIKYSSWEMKKNYILLKKIRNNLFPDVKIKIEQIVFIKNTKSLTEKQFLPKKTCYYNSTKTFSYKQKEKQKLLTSNRRIEKKVILIKKTLQFLKILDNYGNLY